VSAEPPAVACDPNGGRCITCSDEAIPMRVLRGGQESVPCADEQGVTHSVAVELVAPVATGDAVLVHAGVAIRHLGPVA